MAANSRDNVCTVAFTVLLAFGSNSCTSDTDFDSVIPHGHAAWVYGNFVSNIADYNQQSSANRIKNILLVGGEVNVFCDNETECTRADLDAIYYVDVNLKIAFLNSANDIEIVPTLDGRVGSAYVHTGFNNLLDSQARWLALEVGAAYCAEDIPGIQVDIEPFSSESGADIGQLAFYRNLADVLAGKHDGYTDEYIDNTVKCVNEKYPAGRYFSIFMSAKLVDNFVIEILHRNGNGFIDVSGYDITSRDSSSESVFADPQQYKVALTTSIRAIQAAEVMYRLSLPFAASQTEFEALLTENGMLSGFPQADYIDAAISVIHETEVCEDERFRGISIWGFSNPERFGNTRPSFAGATTLSRLSNLNCNQRF